MGKTWAKLDCSLQLHLMPTLNTYGNQLSLALTKEPVFTPTQYRLHADEELRCVVKGEWNRWFTPAPWLQWVHTRCPSASYLRVDFSRRDFRTDQVVESYRFPGSN